MWIVGDSGEMSEFWSLSRASWWSDMSLLIAPPLEALTVTPKLLHLLLAPRLDFYKTTSSIIVSMWRGKLLIRPINSESIVSPPHIETIVRKVL